jgi:Protein of unknown function (DUF2721)
MAAPISESPFAVLTLIAAPAVFTNASSVLALGTGNRLARVVDRTRELVRDLHTGAETHTEVKELWVRHLDRLEQRGSLLVRAMRCFYGAIACFASASVVSILGASIVSSQYTWTFEAIVGISFVAGVAGFIGLAVGCSFLVRETRLALRSLSEEADLARSWTQAHR